MKPSFLNPSITQASSNSASSNICYIITQIFLFNTHAYYLTKNFDYSQGLFKCAQNSNYRRYPDMKRCSMNIVRNNPHKVSQISEIVRLSAFDDAFIAYNGAPEPYEDPADYIRVKGGRIA